MGLELPPARRQNNVRQEGLLTERLHIVEEHRVMIIPLQTEVLGGHSSLLFFASHFTIYSSAGLAEVVADDLCNCETELI